MSSKVAALSLALLAVSAPALTFRSAQEGFAISSPAGWQKGSYPGTVVVFLAPKALPNFQPNVNVVVERLPKGITAKQYNEFSLKGLESAITDYKLLSSRSITVGGAPANELIFQGRQGKSLLFFHSTTIIKGGRAYIITGTTALGSQATLLPTMKTFVRSFKFLR